MKELRYPAVVILGPTASGKSHLANEVAKRYNGEIVNCDSVQIYRGFVIGAAKATQAEQREIPHYLLDIAGPDDEFTAGDYAREARKVLISISERRKLPIVVGGTGFYLKAVLHGLPVAPLRNQSLRSRLQRVRIRRPAALHRLLTAADSAAAARIHPNDHQKLIRAIEIASSSRESTSEKLEDVHQELSPFRILKVGLSPPRPLLHEAVNNRTMQMFTSGLLEETRQLLATGYGPESKPMQSLGYRQAVQVLSGTASLSAAIEDCQAKTRQYVKRQMTWFRKEDDVHWMEGFGTDCEIQADVFSLVAGFLGATYDDHYDELSGGQLNSFP